LKAKSGKRIQKPFRGGQETGELKSRVFKRKGKIKSGRTVNAKRGGGGPGGQSSNEKNRRDVIGGSLFGEKKKKKCREQADYNEEGAAVGGAKGVNLVSEAPRLSIYAHRS